MGYLIVLEQSATGFSAYSSDVPGCVAPGESLEQTFAWMKEALVLHLQAMAEDGEPMPQPKGVQAYVEAAVASEGEEYYRTHVAVGDLTPQQKIA